MLNLKEVAMSRDIEEATVVERIFAYNRSDG